MNCRISNLEEFNIADVNKDPMKEFHDRFKQEQNKLYMEAKR